MRTLANLQSAPLSLVLVFVLGVAALAVAFLPVPWSRISRGLGAVLWIGAAELLCAYFLAPFWFYRVAVPVGVLFWIGYLLTFWRHGGGQPVAVRPTGGPPSVGIHAAGGSGRIERNIIEGYDEGIRASGDWNIRKNRIIRRILPRRQRRGKR